MTRDDRNRVLLVGIVWGLLGLAPYVRATLHPPPERWFSGFFAFQDDFYQYLSFSEQAGRGAFLFTNKFSIAPHEGFLVNLEWWAAGLLGRAASPIEGFHALGFLATLGLALAAGRLMALAGLHGARLIWGTALFATGGGLGWVRLIQGVERSRIPDLATLIFPWSQRAFGSAHALAATALFLAALLLHVEWREGKRSKLAFLAAATSLGLVRPFDLGLFGLVALALVAGDVASGRAAKGLRRALELLWLAPIALYTGLVYFAHPAFAVWSGPQNTVALPSTIELAFALGPAAGLACLFAWRRAPGETTLGPPLRQALGVAAALGAALVFLPGAGFGFQFATLLGPLLLLLVALGAPPRGLPFVALALLPSSVLVLLPLLRPPAATFPPRDYHLALELLRSRCGPGERVVAPVNFSLLAAGLTPCSVVIGHRVLTPEWDRRAEESEHFFDPQTAEAWRRQYLRDVAARFAVVPAGRGGWLDPALWEPQLATALLEVWRRRH